jgi:hypothetical protein
MDKRLIYLLIGVIGLHLAVDLFSNRNLSEALDRISVLETQLGQASVATAAAQVNTDSILFIVNDYQTFLGTIEKGIEILDMERRINQGHFASQRDSLKLSLIRQSRLIDSLRLELPADDPIVIRSRSLATQVSLP